MIKKSHVAVLLALLALGALAAAPPQLVSYQGVLKDSGGNPLTGSYAMTFAFYDAASVGTLLLTDSHPSVSVTSGLFTVILGGGTITPGSEPTLEGVFGRRSTVWLETRVGAQTLTPRVQVLSVGYAQNANLLDGSDSTAFAAVSHPHSGADITSGTVAAARGGTGLSSPGATGNLLTSNGSIWTSAAPSFLTTEVDGVVGNEVTAASNATLTRSGSGTGGSPFTLGLNLSNANSWSGAQTFGASTNFPGSGIWDSTGKVGIGVNSGLIFPLSIKATQGIAQLLTTGSTNGSVLELRNDAPSRTYLGAINFARPAGITGQIGYLETDTMLFNTNSAERMRIDSAGNVGIGTASPSLKLEVQGTQGVARITSTSSTNGSVLVLKNSTASPTYVGAINFNDSAAGQIGYLGTDAMTVKTNGAEAMRILSNGRVGIGRTDASARLDVRATASEQVAIAGWGSVIGVEGVSDPDGHASGYLGVWNGIDSYGIEASGATAAGEFTNSAAGQYAQVAYSTYKIQGSGTVSFVQNDPVHDDRVIVYASPEGDEVATYTRGTARLVNGEIRVRLGETFQWVTNPDLGLTAHLTPRGDCKGLYVETLSTSEMVVKELGGGRSDAAFDYLVYGLRIGFEESSIVQEKQHESYIPSFTSHRERYAIYPGLRAFNALERFKAMTSSVTGVAPGALDLSRAAALKAAIHEYDPAVDPPVKELLGYSHDLTRGHAATMSTPASTATPSPERGNAPVPSSMAVAPPPADSESDVYGRSFRPSSSELARSLEVTGTVETGDVIVVDREHAGFMKASTSAADPTVVGIVAGEPGVVLGTTPPRKTTGEPEADAAAPVRAPVALSGIVLCKVDAGFGAIAVGDLLTTSPTPGHAMPATNPAPGTVLGKALQALPSGTGLIQVLVMLR